ncbi:hypothetical protein HDU98_008180, partial [Podochytrium sp. JEL0797]
MVININLTNEELEECFHLAPPAIIQSESPMDEDDEDMATGVGPRGVADGGRHSEDHADSIRFSPLPAHMRKTFEQGSVLSRTADRFHNNTHHHRGKHNSSELRCERYLNVRARAVKIDFVARMLNRGSMYYTLGMKGYYIAFPAMAYLRGRWTLLGTTVLLMGILRIVDFHLEDLSPAEFELDESLTCANRCEKTSGNVDCGFPRAAGVVPIKRAPEVPILIEVRRVVVPAIVVPTSLVGIAAEVEIGEKDVAVKTGVVTTVNEEAGAGMLEAAGIEDDDATADEVEFDDTTVVEVEAVEEDTVVEATEMKDDDATADKVEVDDSKVVVEIVAVEVGGVVETVGIKVEDAAADKVVADDSKVVEVEAVERDAVAETVAMEDDEATADEVEAKDSVLVEDTAVEAVGEVEADVVEDDDATADKVEAEDGEVEEEDSAAMEVEAVDAVREVEADVVEDDDATADKVEVEDVV